MVNRHNVGKQSSYNRHSHYITHKTLAISSARRRRKQRKRDIQSGKPSKKLSLISASWAQWALSNKVSNSLRLLRHVRAVGRYSCMKLSKNCLHLVPCYSAAQTQQVHFLSLTSVLVGEGSQHSDIHRCSCCKACVRKAECTKKKCPLCTLLGAGSHISSCTMEGD